MSLFPFGIPNDKETVEMYQQQILHQSSLHLNENDENIETKCQ